MRSKTSAVPTAVSLTPLGAGGRDNQGFAPEPTDRLSSEQYNPHNNGHTHSIPTGRGDPTSSMDAGAVSENGRISVIADNNLLTHRNAQIEGATNVNLNNNCTAHPVMRSEIQNGSGHPISLPRTPNGYPAPQTSNTEDKVEMKKSLSLFHLISMLVSVAGHSSIFISPASILAQTGSVGGSLLAWLLGGLFQMTQALCFAEVGTMYPGPGGPYAYITKAFGPLMGFLSMWGYSVLTVGPIWAFLARTAAVYTLRPVFPGCTSSQIERVTTLLGGWILVTFMMLNCVYVKYVAKVQTFLASCKLVALFIIIAAGAYYIAKGRTENFEAPFENTSTGPGEFGLAIFYATFCYGGWQNLTTVLGEVKDPSRDPPRATSISLSLVICLYLMANVSFLTLLSPEHVKTSTAVASDFIAEISEALAIFVSVLVALTSIGALNASIMGHSRVLFAAGKNGHMPQIFAMLHAKYLTPWPSIFVNTAWSLVMLFTGGVIDMMDYISLCSTMLGLLVVSAQLYFRWTKPDMERPYKTVLALPILQIVFGIAILALGIYQKPSKMGTALFIVFAGTPIYCFGVLWRNKPREFTDIINKLTAFSQKLFLLAKVKN